MRQSILFIIMTASSLYLQAQDIEKFAERQLKDYPQSRLLDIYKSCFQDFMGPEHLVTNSAAVMNFIEKELATSNTEEMMPWYYEYCGVDSNYVRVSLKAVKENIITKHMLADAFMRSAVASKRPSQKAWKKKWNRMAKDIDRMGLELKDYRSDRLFIDSLLQSGKYATSHSPEYRKAYNPHYRIVERTIFEHEILPAIISTAD